MSAYEELLAKVLEEGQERTDRTGTGTLSIFGAQMCFNLEEGFPLITSKRVHFKSVVGELLWFLEGSSDVDVLRDKYGVTIWDEWAEDGNIGPMYGTQWRDWGGEGVWDSYNDEPNDGYGIDQIREVVENIKEDPYSRRHVVSAWNVGLLDSMALAPCHVLFQFYVQDGKLSCHLYQRSADMFLGVPFNIASYALLTHLIAKATGLGVGEFIWSGGDVHIYKNHIEKAKLQLSREERPFPKLGLFRIIGTDIDGWRPEDIDVNGYNPHPGIKAQVAV